MADVCDDRVATAIIPPTCIDRTEGILVVCCTKRSNVLRRRHKRIDGSIIHKTPSWLLFHCYFFEGMSLFNWSEISDPTYAALGKLRGVFGDFLNEQCGIHGISHNVTGDPRSYYNLTPGESYLKGLRELLGRLGVQVWLELSSCCSAAVYGALHVSVRMFAGTYVEPPASQYLLCQSWVPRPRKGPSANS